TGFGLRASGRRILRSYSLRARRDLGLCRPFGPFFWDFAAAGFSGASLTGALFGFGSASAGASLAAAGSAAACALSDVSGGAAGGASSLAGFGASATAVGAGLDFGSEE